MLRFLPSAIDEALDTLYEPNAVFSRFLRSASMTFFSVFLCLVPLLTSLVYLAFLVFISIPFLSFPFLSHIFISLFLFSTWLASDVRMRSDRYHV